MKNISILLTLFPQGEKPSLIEFLLVVIAGIFMALAVHELGHLLTGLAQGFSFQLFVVGPLGIRRRDSGIQIYLNKNVGMMGGAAATTPVAVSPENRMKFARLILAGPVSSLAFGLIMLALAPLSGNALLTWFLFIAGGSSVGLFAATTVPKKSGIYFTDRARFQRLISKGKAAESEEALLSIIAQSLAENSHRNLSLDQIRSVQQDDAPFMKFWGYYYEYLYLKENGSATQEQARLQLVANKSLVDKQVWKMLSIPE